MRKFIGYIIIIALPVIIGFVYYRYYLTTGNIWSKQCSFHELTGIYCPGCGGQRAFYFLLHGDILQALRYNFLLVVILPVLLYIYFLLSQVYILKNKNYLKYFNFSEKFGYIFIAVLTIFFILRNIPLFPFTYLAPPQ
jgi:hypothetical protein